jgi:hypothetical protein
VNFSDPFGLCPTCELAGATVAATLVGPAFQALNPGGFVVSNPLVRINTVALSVHLADQRGNDGFEFRVTGGDRFVGEDGRHRSRTNGGVIDKSASNSPHLEETGARSVDLRIRGVSDEVVDAAIEKTQFQPASTRRAYADKHTHVNLPNQSRFRSPK